MDRFTPPSTLFWLKNLQFERGPETLAPRLAGQALDPNFAAAWLEEAYAWMTRGTLVKPR
jgi:hypothetical protein